VILDLVLHGAEAGWDLLQALAANAGAPCFPVVCTAKSLVDGEEALLSALAAGSVRKPFDIDELLGAIGAALVVGDPRKEESGARNGGPPT
jgi:DNA-binding response OmpR family regulator